jgi:hypothetical protein
MREPLAPVTLTVVMVARLPRHVDGSERSGVERGPEVGHERRTEGLAGTRDRPV